MIARVLLFAALVGWTSRARAQELPEAVVLSIVRCDEAELDTDGLFERARVELASDGVLDVRRAPDDEGVAAPGLAFVRVEATPCAPGSTAFVVRIDDRVTSKRVERSFELAETAPGARSRALALAIAELLRASWAELAIADPPIDAPAPVLEAMLERVRLRGLRDARALGTPTAPPEVEPASVEPAREPSGDEARTTLGAAFVVRAFPSGTAAPMGGRLSVDVRPVAELDLRVDVEGAVGTTLHPLGTIELGLATLGASASYALGLGDARLGLGARVAAGAAWAIGRPYDAGTPSGGGAGVLVSLGAIVELDVPIAGPLSLRFGAEVGATLAGFEARVGTAPIAGLTGAQLGAWGGLAIAP